VTEQRDPEQRDPGRLDPDRAIEAAGGPPPQKPAPAIDSRPYRWMIGILGIALLIAFSVYEFNKHGIVTPGVAAGKRLHYFVAPLATIGPDQPANPRPRCDPAHPNPRALNVCGRTPLVLAFFATGSGACKRQVDTLQALSRRVPAGSVQFAAIAINAGRSETAKLVRQRHWTIPVAFDSEGAVGALYNADICPIVELAYRGGTVADRLIGEHWLNEQALLARVRRIEPR
jgi:thiol-disulfide isomerase/thioredoxin